MSPETVRLTEVEQLVLFAVLRLGEEAFAVPIRALVGKEAGIDLSRGSVYVALDRLERKGYLESWSAAPVAEPGGKARRLFRMCPADSRLSGPPDGPSSDLPRALCSGRRVSPALR